MFVVRPNWVYKEPSYMTIRSFFLSGSNNNIQPITFAFARGFDGKVPLILLELIIMVEGSLYLPQYNLFFFICGVGVLLNIALTTTSYCLGR